MNNCEKNWQDTFAPELAMISDNGLRTKVLDILNMYVLERHKVEGASSTGKYHPSFSQGTGGLIRHTKAVVFLVKELCQTRPDINKDTLIAAAILHDMCKYSKDSTYTLHQHPALMAMLCMDEGLPQVAHLIESHMGQWNTGRGSTIVLPLPISSEEWLLHYADYLASRKWLSLPFNEENEIAFS